jgi:hypothetical protein
MILRRILALCFMIAVSYGQGKDLERDNMISLISLLEKETNKFNFNEIDQIKRKLASTHDNQFVFCLILKRSFASGFCDRFLSSL